jgi:hypothetical protein
MVTGRDIVEKTKDISMDQALNTNAGKSTADTVPTLKNISSVITKMGTSELTPEQCCENAGLTLERIYNKLSSLLDAKMLIKTRYDEISVDDNKTQMAAVQITLELRKHIKDKTTVTQVGIFNDPRVVDEAQRVLGMRDRI